MSTVVLRLTAQILGESIYREWERIEPPFRVCWDSEKGVYKISQKSAVVCQASKHFISVTLGKLTLVCPRVFFQNAWFFGPGYKKFSALRSQICRPNLFGMPKGSPQGTHSPRKQTPKKCTSPKKLRPGLNRIKKHRMNRINIRINKTPRAIRPQPLLSSAAEAESKMVPIDEIEAFGPSGVLVAGAHWISIVRGPSKRTKIAEAISKYFCLVSIIFQRLN